MSCTKVEYSNMEAAIRAAENYSQSAYKCKECGGFHLTNWHSGPDVFVSFAGQVHDTPRLSRANLLDKYAAEVIDHIKSVHPDLEQSEVWAVTRHTLANLLNDAKMKGLL